MSCPDPAETPIHECIGVRNKKSERLNTIEEMEATSSVVGSHIDFNQFSHYQNNDGDINEVDIDVGKFERYLIADLILTKQLYSNTTY